MKFACRWEIRPCTLNEAVSLVIVLFSVEIETVSVSVYILIVCFDDLDFDTRSQWIGKVKKSAVHALSN